ncbi:class I SAM-dependent methyltransferase [Nocardioides sp. AE5]|uniref:class I SAM-dependent methyltransferase n=1 Tax=Nocardioides sp. AE5 TaxID=2962573 RepID=UPI002881EAA1|nr:class I SAM-dependent methyltransferase [Nocardioides sp. AE5]MDT0203563.1 class I SAM-dependent methyltransferase [Nocardioides sp. AE5]
MGWWEERVVPHLVDRALRGREIGAWRERCCAGLAGRVLEIGFGGGLNTRFYPDAVESVDAVEPSDRAWALSARRREPSTVPVHRVGLDGQHLAAADATYDAVLCTFSVCTIPDPALALREMHRVLRPGGTLHLLEHGLSPDPGVRRWQQRMEPVQRRVAGGCHLTRDPVALAEAAGFTMGQVENAYLLSAKVSAPMTYGYLATGQA